MGHVADWDSQLAPLHCLNFGIGGDRTEHVLWRAMNGELDNINAKVVVIWCGTNNHGNSPEQVCYKNAIAYFVLGILISLQLYHFTGSPYV